MLPKIKYGIITGGRTDFDLIFAENGKIRSKSNETPILISPP